VKFAVIEGLDGSGKSTQIGLLKDFLNSKKIPFEFLHFPRTGSPVYGELISGFLRGEFGSNEAVNPYLVALLYAGDRKDAAPEIFKWLEEKKLVITDRYVFSNVAYQCAKLDNVTEKDKLKKWILNFEYSYNKIPIPDINIFLDVPFNFTIQQLKQDRSGADRKYLQGNSDIHEADINFQYKVREMYIELSKTESSLKMISCSENNQIMKPFKIFELIIDCLRKENILE
jgi:dTMP kinase